ncbi:hypothetical protein NPIL_419981 [Nephila pilipes]|uniref:C2H2-type domain-containing protein n=1 Tax=Nephila pilipes TaxID=299642 RepID=A0A8X6K2K7_NEPPI|nr:hypothetical protein NPIL_419981 [Nephila pilipes]
MSHLSSTPNARNNKLTVYEQCKKIIEAKCSYKRLKEEKSSENKSINGNDTITTKNEIKNYVSRKRKDRFLKDNASVLKMLYSQFIEAQNIANNLKKQAQTQPKSIAKPKPMLPKLYHQNISKTNSQLSKQSDMMQSNLQKTIQDEIIESVSRTESLNTKSCQEPVVQIIQVLETGKVTVPKFDCSMCDAHFKSKRELIFHINSFHKGEANLNENKLVYCIVCDKKFKRTKTFVDRCRNHSAAPYACEVCKKGYFSGKRLKFHHCKATKEKKPSVWDACKKVLAKKSLQQEPKNVQISTPRLPIIKNVFQVVNKSSKASTFLKLQKESASSKNFTDGNCNLKDCEYSDVRFTDINNFQSNSNSESHPSTADDTTILSCNICSCIFTGVENFQSHCLTHSNEEVCHLNEGEESLHVCNICGKCFTEAESFQSHLLLHGEKEFNSARNIEESKSSMCSKCLLYFTNLADFHTHCQTHSVCKESLSTSVKNEKCYICNMCGSSFINLENLQSHSLSHVTGKLCNVNEEKKPIVCNICGQCFTVLENFQLHCLTHDIQSLSKNTLLKTPII